MSCLRLPDPSEQTFDFENCWHVIRRRLDKLPEWQWILLSALAAILLSITFFSPKYWILREPMPGAFEWDRGLTFIRQSESPWDSDLEPAMRWRLLPAQIAHLVHLRGRTSLVIPWFGLLIWLATTASLVGRYAKDRLLGAVSASIVATGAGAITITNWHGINDGWYLAGLTVVSLGHSRPWLAVAGLLCPWVDERFLLALPLAIICRWSLQSSVATVSPRDFVLETTLIMTGVAIYSVARIAVTRGLVADSEATFLTAVFHHLRSYVSYVPMGWFMGWRAAWAYIIALPFLLWLGGRPWLAALLTFVAAGTSLALLFIATDISRSIAVLAPVVMTSIVLIARLDFPKAWRHCAIAIALVNLAIPFMHVIGSKLSVVNSAPVELFRFAKTMKSE